MPSVSYSKAAIGDLERLTQFLLEHDHDHDIAVRAIASIRQGLDKAVFMPARFRRVPEWVGTREVIIDFGRSGYLAMIRELPDGAIRVLRIRHQLEERY